MKTEVIRINVGDGYDVTVGSNILDSCGQYVSELLDSRKTAIITDSNVAPLYLSRVCDSLEKSGFSVSAYTFEAGETSKNMRTLSDILEFLAESQLTRQDCVIALGGGVVGDMTGFAAGCYLRGIKFIQIPTTLLAAVDSSVGGKTAVDLNAGKNLAGLFIQPEAVLYDIDTLKTLTPHFFADGMAEAVKTAILCGDNMLKLFERNEINNNLYEIITGCIKYKGNVVEIDERESGVRQLLNLGHTAGHAVEKCSGFTITHGHAVAVGTAIICRAAARLGFCNAAFAEGVEAVLDNCELPTTTKYNAKQLTEAALVDKKRRGEYITLVLPRAAGDCILHRISVTELEKYFSAGLERCK